MKTIIRSVARRVRALTPRGLRRIIARIGRFFGEEESPFVEMENALGVLAARGFNPKTCIDIGAYHGVWTRIFRRSFPSCRVLMIEAQFAKHRILEKLCDESDGAVACDISLLGSVDGKEVAFVEMETGSSVFEEESPYPRTTSTRTTTSLDTVLRNRSEFGAVDFMKLDVQGYELEVLKGATTALSKTEAILLEASLLPMNKGCPLIDEVMTFLSDAGFQLVDICGQSRTRDGVLFQVDLLFVREKSRFLPEARLSAKNWQALRE